jgi:hypothetical protein
MELFEILFILFFILIPIFEGLRKSRQRRSPGEAEAPERPARTGGDPYDRPPGPPPPRSEPELDTSEAADMLPDDLWEVLTGERRTRTEPVEARTDDEYEDQEEYTTWRDVPAWEPEREPEEAFQAEAEAHEEERFEPAPWLEDDGMPAWQDTAPPAEAMARAAQAPMPEAPSHQLGSLGSLGDAIGTVSAPRRRSPLMTSLRSTQGLRQAVLLREILGPPKGLDR